jgi:hypothetical protein
MNRRILRLFLLTATSFAIGTGLAQAQKATDADMARNALIAELRTADSKKIQDLRERSNRSLDQRVELVSRRGLRDEPIVATVVFGQGMSVPTLGGLMRSGGFELVSAQVMFPSEAAGVIHTVNLGAEEIALLEGTAESRLLKAIGHAQWRFLESAKRLPPNSTERADFMSVATTPPPLMRVYKIVLSGSARELQLLRRDERTALVDAVNGEQRQQELVQLHEQMSQRKRAGGRPAEIGMRGALPAEVKEKGLVK